MNSDIDKKNLILEKAKDMIITESYSSLSISKLTSELNISKGSFYTYFPSKDKMLSEILDEYIKNIKNITIFKNNLLENSKNIDECLDYYINSLLNLTDDELKLELVITNLKRNYEVFNEENFIKLKNTARKTIDFIKSILRKYKKSINIKEKDMEKCSKMIFSITEVFLMMQNINFETNKFSSKSLDEVKDLYRSQDMKENLEFIKESIKKILYR
ncbi:MULTISPECIES: TetR/AcrR family transcriptional regulator [Fusobacterium]|uniref:TetR/AcrR family transcriptional regulator n=1 Tax=Fusobacterium TaxID=848 RepID=UPI0004458D3E|nr:MULTISPECIES: TetR/AcrR family transcriptional regulator [Fusobacterium]EUB33992.1 transcriptional regulator, TetR family [Fusobacterium sp. OBRC1]WRL73614.1 TetR/AcrR family transcriptional regulator [Fusobacterium polymorphum]